MSISVTDFVNGVDFDAYGTQTAQMHNQLVSLGTVWTDKGLVIRSIDTAANTPDVPDATVTTKWKRYIWLRIPHTSVVPPASTVPFFYAWNDTATSVATYLKWQRIQADFTTVNATIAALQAELDLSQLDITSATNTANAANAAVGTAATDAANAVASTAVVAGNLATLDAQVNHTTSGLAPTRAVADSALGIANAAVTPAQLAAVNNAFNTYVATDTLITSGLYPIVLGTTIQFNHNLLTVPRSIRWVMVCMFADLTYFQGDEVPIAETSFAATNPFLPFTSMASLSALKVQISIITPCVVAGNITIGSWQLKCYYAK